MTEEEALQNMAKLPLVAAEEAYTATLAQITGNLPAYLDDRYNKIRERLEQEYQQRTQPPEQAE